MAKLPRIEMQNLLMTSTKIASEPGARGYVLLHRALGALTLLIQSIAFIFLPSAKAETESITESIQEQPIPTNPKERDETTANNPLSIVTALQVQNYYQPVLKGDRNAGGNQPYLRAILPFTGFGGRNLLRISLPTGSTSWTTNSSDAGLGDLTIFSVRVFKISSNSGFGVGPLLVAPTATSGTLGIKKWQVGAQGTYSAHYPWGLLAGLLSYQQSIDGEVDALTFQPFIFRNIGRGFYLRSSGIMTLDTTSGNGVLPIGLGIGKVSRLSEHKLLNVYLEPQYSLAAGDYQPEFQVFAGFNLQFLPKQ